MNAGAQPDFQPDAVGGVVSREGRQRRKPRGIGGRSEMSENCFGLVDATVEVGPDGLDGGDRAPGEAPPADQQGEQAPAEAGAEERVAGAAEVRAGDLFGGEDTQ